MSPLPARRHQLVLVLTSAAILVGSAVPSRAVPVFSRKYQTSCQTCHTAFPKLNPFGEAFRLNGYRMPKETEDQVKQTPVSLGSDAYKKMWPQAVFPSDLPGGAPFALNVKLANVYAVSHGEGGEQKIKNDFQFPQEANLFAAGTLGATFGFFGELTFEDKPDGSAELGIEHARLDVDSPFGPENLFHFRIGKFAPNLYDGFQEMWIMTDNAIDTVFAYNPIGLNGGTGLAEDGGGIGLPDRVRGIEMYGVAKHRLFYTVGVDQTIGAGGPNDMFASNNHKDVYGRVDWKFGGMGLDGDTGGKPLPAENWREKSLRVGVFGFTGNGSDVLFDQTDEAGTAFKMQDVRYGRVGGYASLYYGDLNLFGVVVHGNDKLQLLDANDLSLVDETSHGYNAWFAEGDYVIRPPFQVALRYEHLSPGDASVPSLKFLNANFTFLVRANVKAMAEYRRDLGDSHDYALNTIVRFAF